MHTVRQHQAHQHVRCTAGSMGESQETASAEVVFLLEKPPPPCLLQPQADDTAPTCSTATFLHGLQLEPSSGWTAAASINPEVRKAEKQFKNLCRKKNQNKTKTLTYSPTPQQGGTSPSTTLCSHTQTLLSHASLRHPYQHSGGIPGLKTPLCAL